MKAAELMTDAFLFKNTDKALIIVAYRIMIDAPSWQTSCATRCIFRHAPIDQLNMEGHPFFKK
jgi:hypothetical protein